jgi:hypothetical protein
MEIPLFVGEKPGPQATTRPLTVGCLIFERMDQIDFAGPFEVLSRMKETTVRVVGKELSPIRDVLGLRLIPDVSIAEVGTLDVLLVPGGYGQQALMHDEEVLALIRKQVEMYDDDEAAGDAAGAVDADSGMITPYCFLADGNRPMRSSRGLKVKSWILAGGGSSEVIFVSTSQVRFVIQSRR